MIWKHSSHRWTFQPSLSLCKGWQLCPEVFVASSFWISEHVLMSRAQIRLCVYHLVDLSLCLVMIFLDLWHCTFLRRLERWFKQITALNGHSMLTDTWFELTLGITFGFIWPIPLSLWITRIF